MVKALLKRVKDRPREALVEATGLVLDAVMVRDARGSPAAVTRSGINAREHRYWAGRSLCRSSTAGRQLAVAAQGRGPARGAVEPAVRLASTWRRGVIGRARRTRSMVWTDDRNGQNPCGGAPTTLTYPLEQTEGGSQWL